MDSNLRFIGHVSHIEQIFLYYLPGDVQVGVRCVCMHVWQCMYACMRAALNEKSFHWVRNLGKR